MDVFDLVAKIRLDSSEYEQGVGKAKGTFSTLASGVKTGLATVVKVGAAAVTAGVAGVTALTKMGVEGYAQYEQLVGGVETLFKDSQGTVMKYAENAYKTAGMSANQYMETVTSFSASLIQSLDGDTAKAAEVGNIAITDMSDNANKMGTSMEMIQNAYNGFAKQNYTMLDNLKLGYGGTKEEMQRLLKDAEKISGIKYDISSFSDVAEAIHVMQKNMEISGYSADELSEKLRTASLTQEEVSKVAKSMGISYEEASQRMKDGSLTIKDANVLLGTTAREAATTIEGSISMMKGAWKNLVVGMADENANMEVLINNFVESTATAAQNLLPRIEQTLVGIGQLITALAPVIADALPQLVESVLPALLTAGVSLVTALVKGVITALPALYTALLDAVQIILVQVFGVSEAKAGEFADSVNSFFTKIKDGFVALVESAQTEGTWLNEIWTGLQNTAQLFGDFLSALWDTISAAWAWCVESINTEGTYLNTIWQNIQIRISVAVANIQEVITLFTAILQGDWSTAWDAIKNIVENVWNAMCDIISNNWDLIKKTVKKALDAVKSAIKKEFDAVKTNVTTTWNNIKTAISNALNSIRNTVSSVWNTIKSTISSVLNNISSTVSNVWNSIKSAISNVLNSVSNKVSEVWNYIHSNISNIVNGISDTLGKTWNFIHSNLSNIVNGISKTIGGVWEFIHSNIANIINGISTTLSNAWNFIHTTISNILSGISQTVSGAWETIKTTVSGAIGSVKSSISSGMEGAKTAVSDVLDGIKSKFSTIWENCKTIVTNAVTALKNALNFSWSLPELKLPHISVSGGVAPYGIGGKGSLPKFSIEWYKKAYDNAMVLSSPTIFGYSDGKFLGGGDGNGNEIVAGESHLMNMIGDVVESKTAQQNEQIVSLLSALLSATVDGNNETVRALLAGHVIKLNEREFARAVRTYA